jgi:acetoin utilization protein AcuB
MSRYMTRQPWTISSGATMSQAHALMRSHRIRHLPVLEGGKLVGVVTERDLHLIETLPGGNADDVKVEEAMVTDVYVAGSDDPVDEVVEEMATHKYGSVVIVDHHGAIEGIFTTVDALAVLATVLRKATA